MHFSEVLWVSCYIFYLKNKLNKSKFNYKLTGSSCWCLNVFNLERYEGQQIGANKR